MSRCLHCNFTLGRKNGVFCSDPFEKLFHADCVNIPAVSGFWCYSCKHLDNKFDPNTLNYSFDKCYNDFYKGTTEKVLVAFIKFLKFVTAHPLILCCSSSAEKWSKTKKTGTS